MGLKAVSSSGVTGFLQGNVEGVSFSLKNDMPILRQSLYDQISQRTSPKWLYWGESHIADQGGGTAPPAAGLTNAWPFGLMQQTARLLAGNFGAMNMNSIVGEQNCTTNSVAYPTYDPRAVFTGGVGGDGSALAFGGRFILMTGSSQSITLTFPNAYDRVTMMQAIAPVASTSLVVTNANGTLGTLNQNGSVALSTVTYNTTLGSSPLVITNTDASNAGRVTLVWAWNSTLNQIQCFQAGYQGGVAANVFSNAQPYSPVQMVTALAPKMTFFEEYINDIIIPTNVNTFGTSFDLGLSTAKISGDALVYAGFPCNDANWTANITAYMAQMQAKCDARNINLIDLRPWFGYTWAAANAAGYTSDAYHPSPLAYSIWSRINNAIIRSVLK